MVLGEQPVINVVHGATYEVFSIQGRQTLLHETESSDFLMSLEHPFSAIKGLAASSPSAITVFFLVSVFTHSGKMETDKLALIA